MTAVIDAIINAITIFFETVNTTLSDYILVILLIGAGLFFTIRTRFVQVRCFGEGIKQVFGGVFSRHKGEGLSSFQALATAIAAQVGTGNIVGASSAILIGGPGAIFWMWVIAFLSMATNYAEAVLAQKTRVVDGEEVFGGPVYYIKRAFRGTFGKILAVIFAVTAMLALGFMGLMVQSRAIADTFVKAFGIPDNFLWIVGLVLVALCALIFFGGVKRLAAITEKMVPFMAIAFLICGLVILCIRVQYIPQTFGMIFKYAFTPASLIGGGVGIALKTAISQGAKRGLFSNEAGMGSTPHAHAMASVKHPHEQGVAAMIGVFIDTFLVLTMTALVIISTLYCGGGPLAGKTDISNPTYSALIESEVVEDTNAMQLAVSSAFGDAFENIFGDAYGDTVGNAFGNIFVAICLFFFAFSTIMCWNFFGRLNAQYLFKNKKIFIIIYSVISITFVFLGTVSGGRLVWALTDFFNNLMVIPNVIALIALSRLVVDETKEARKRKKEKKLNKVK